MIAGEGQLTHPDATKAPRNHARLWKWETSMHIKLALALAFVTAATATAPTFAAASMMSGGSMMAGGHGMMLKPGESVMMMPNGETMMMPAMKGEMDPAAMKAAMPMDKCMIMMMGADHKMHMLEDMKLSNGKMACDAMTMMMKK